MAKALARILLYLAVPALLGLITWYGYLADRDLQRIHQYTAATADISLLQSAAARIVADFSDIETGQRGFLITGDPDYLKPYTEARTRLETHFADLRSRLEKRSAKELADEKQLESLAHAQLAEMDETIRLRQQGYRHRAFLIVSSDRGKERVDQARARFTTLDATADRDLALLQQETSEAINAALKDSVIATVLLFAVTAVIFAGYLSYLRHSEREIARTKLGLRQADANLSVIAKTIEQDIRTRLTEVQEMANALMEGYATFLPQRAVEQVEHIRETTDRAQQQLGELPAGSASAEAA